MVASALLLGSGCDAAGDAPSGVDSDAEAARRSHRDAGSSTADADGDTGAIGADGAGSSTDAGPDSGVPGSDGGTNGGDAGALSTNNLYVTPGGAGARDGSSWSNALGGLAGITFSGAHALTAGTTLWMAGGAYPGSLSIGASGTASARIIIKRATAANPECTGSTGWSGAFDSQVVIGGGGVTPIVLPGAGMGGDYLTIDGQIDDGIKLLGPDNDGGGVVYQQYANSVELVRLDIAGVTGASSHTFLGDARGVDATPTDRADGLVIRRCRIHGFPNLVYTANVHDVLIEHTLLYDNDALNSATYHPNVYISVGSGDVVFRYNDVSNWAAEGILLWGGTPQPNWKIYGNVFHDSAPGAYARALEIQNGTHGPISFENNTLVNMWLAVLDDGGGGLFATGSEARNNIYWNGPGWGTSALSRDYTFTDGDVSDAHGIARGANPFVSLAGRDYHITTTTGASYPRDRGAVLGAEFATDADGTTRGADGYWDIGAYEAVR